MKKICILLFAVLLFSCKKNDSGSTLTEYYFTDCDNAIVSGDYFKDSTLKSTNEITLSVNAHKTGSWNIKTATQNGMSFSGSGEFTTTGDHTITLKGSGKPVATGTSDIRVLSGSDFCVIPIKVDTVAVAPCSPTNNSISGLTSSSFYSVSGNEFGGVYDITAHGSGCDLKFEFATAIPPKSGAYRIKPLASDFYTGDVRVSLVAFSIFFQSSDGVVYVNNVNGKITVTFCNVRFSGTNGTNSFSGTASARVVK